MLLETTTTTLVRNKGTRMSARRRSSSSSGLIRRATTCGLRAIFLISSCCFFLMLSTIPLTEASIMVMESGRRYESRQEKFGKQLWRGYEYMARLQYLDANPFLCPSVIKTNYTLTVPTDGVPVALLARGGMCSLKEMADFVLNHVRPVGVVRYVIVGSGHKATTLSLGNNDVNGMTEDDVMLHLGAEELADTEGSQGVVDPESRPLPDSLSNYFGDYFSDPIVLLGDDDDLEVPIFFVHVSLHTQVALLVDVIRQQSPEVQRQGGPRITLDSRSGMLDGESALWIAVSALISACACSFLLISNGNRNGWWEPPPQHHHHHVRQPRRRLTREQVKRLLPRYVYEARTQMLHLEQQHHRAEAEELEGGLSLQQQPSQQQPATVIGPLELDCCSICLDEYEDRDKLRCLPCTHAFHSKCIGKWLAERSATCPLCKTELIHEDDDEDEEELEPGIHRFVLPAAVAAPPAPAVVTTTAEPNGAGWWDRLQHPWQAGGGEGTTSLVGTNPDNTTAAIDYQASDFLRPSWWRRMFPRDVIARHRAGHNNSNNNTLTQPLLAYDIEESGVRLEEMNTQNARGTTTATTDNSMMIMTTTRPETIQPQLPSPQVSPSSLRQDVAPESTTGPDPVVNSNSTTTRAEGSNVPTTEPTTDNEAHVSSQVSI